MIVFINGAFVPESGATVPVFDRGFLYGDGLFETLFVANGVPFRLPQHLNRLRNGAQFLKIDWNDSDTIINERVKELLMRNAITECALRIQLTRGIGERGYSPRNASKPTLVMSVHPLASQSGAVPPQYALITSSFTVLANDPLGQFKTTNKLIHICARAEADRQGVHDALILNHRGEVAETSSANVFWIQRETILTPPIESGALPGITRAAVLELCTTLGLRSAEEPVSLDVLKRAKAVFLTMSTYGLVEVTHIDKAACLRSPTVDRLRSAYLALQSSELNRGSFW